MALGSTDAGPSWSSRKGVSDVAVVGNLTTSATAVTDAPNDSANKLVIDDIFIAVDAACLVTFECETTGADILGVYFGGAGTQQLTPRGELKLATAGKKLTAKASTTVAAAVTVTYHEKP